MMDYNEMVVAAMMIMKMTMIISIGMIIIK